MKVFNSFSEMFNAQSGIKSDMGVFNATNNNCCHYSMWLPVVEYCLGVLENDQKISECFDFEVDDNYEDYAKYGRPKQYGSELEIKLVPKTEEAKSLGVYPKIACRVAVEQDGRVYHAYTQACLLESFFDEMGGTVKSVNLERKGAWALKQSDTWVDAVQQCLRPFMKSLKREIDTDYYYWRHKDDEDEE